MNCILNANYWCIRNKLDAQTNTIANWYTALTFILPQGTFHLSSPILFVNRFTIELNISIFLQKAHKILHSIQILNIHCLRSNRFINYLSNLAHSWISSTDLASFMYLGGYICMYVCALMLVITKFLICEFPFEFGISIYFRVIIEKDIK